VLFRSYQGETPYAENSAPVESGATTALSADDSALVFSAMFGDACAFIAKSDFVAPGFSIASCRAFGGGVLTQGLLALVDKWYQTSYIEAEINIRSVESGPLSSATIDMPELCTRILSIKLRVSPARTRPLFLPPSSPP
jgi:hypothetical protein